MDVIVIEGSYSLDGDFCLDEIIVQSPLWCCYVTDWLVYFLYHKPSRLCLQTRRPQQHGVQRYGFFVPVNLAFLEDVPVGASLMFSGQQLGGSIFFRSSW